ncbi:MAG TPA: hypothetical protein VGL03_13940 [Thermoanaerobaculia bacterium]|jgi:hypothetical protein
MSSALETPAVSATTPAITAAGDVERSSRRVLAEAEQLGIPWTRILLEEIQAERTLRSYLGELDCPWSLREALWVLPHSLLHSWRVRLRIHRLSLESLATWASEARQELRGLADYLSNRARETPAELVRARHLLFAYRRILALMQARRAAERVIGFRGQRIEKVCRKTGCSPEDARWAVERAASLDRVPLLEDCVRRVREDGFDIPAASTDFESLRLLRKSVKRMFPRGARREAE